MACTLEDIKNMLPPTVCQSDDAELVKIFNSRLLPELWNLISSKAPEETQNVQEYTITPPTTEYALPSDYGSLISVKNGDCRELKQKGAFDCCSSGSSNSFHIKGNNIVVPEDAPYEEMKIHYSIRRPKITSMTDPLPFPDWLCEELAPVLSSGLAYYYFKTNGYEGYISEWEAEFMGKMAEVQDPSILSPCAGGCGGCSSESSWGYGTHHDSIC